MSSPIKLESDNTRVITGPRPMPIYVVTNPHDDRRMGMGVTVTPTGNIIEPWWTLKLQDEWEASLPESEKLGLAGLQQRTEVRKAREKDKAVAHNKEIKEDVMNVASIVPFGSVANGIINFTDGNIGEGLLNVGETVLWGLPYLNEAWSKIPTGILNFKDRYSFVPHSYSYTRGIGRGTEGLNDLMTTGIVRGNPRGTEVTAHSFAKLYRNNRNHFRDIMLSTGIPNIENKFFSRNLTEREFNAIKEASKNYTKPRLSKNLEITYILADPLEEYSTYTDYINDINKTVREVELMPSRILSGEVKVNPTLTKQVDSNIPRGMPIEERFGTNSDYIGDGTPLAYFYSDGRNPILKGYDYAGSDYGVRVNNPETYTPFLHDLHLHPSFFNAPKLSDPNVELFGKGPFGLTLKLDKTTGKPLLYQEPIDFFRNIFNPTGNVSRSIKTFPNYSSWVPLLWDDTYNAAILSGNMDEVLRLRDLHFKVSAPDTKIVDAEGKPIHAYHGTVSKFNIFDPNLIGRLDPGYYYRGFYFTPEKKVAKGYALAQSNYETIPTYIMDTYLNITNPIKVNSNDLHIGEWILKPNNGVKVVLAEIGPDDIILDNTVKYNPDELIEIVASKSNQVKLADPITYDDAGNIIPLSKRDNFNNPDIRYGWMPWILGGGIGANLLTE